MLLQFLEYQTRMLKEHQLYAYVYEWVMLGSWGYWISVFVSVIFAAGMASKGLRLAKKQNLFFLWIIVICDRP